MSNQLSRAVKFIHKTPKALHSFLLTKLFCQTVKFAGTAKVKLIEVSHTQTVLTLKNQKRVQNHIGGIHAVAAALVAESATGILLGMNITSNKLPLLKSMHVDYNRRMEGDLLVKARLTQEQIGRIQRDDKGETVIAVTITDDSGQEPVVCEMTWAWVVKRRD